MSSSTSHFPAYAQLHRGGTSVIVDLTTAGTPALIHWGAPTGVLSNPELESLAVAARPQRVSGGIDFPARLTLLPQEAFGWQGSPALIGQRSRSGWSTALTTTAALVENFSLTITAEDVRGGLTLVTELSLTAAGVLKQRHTLSNTGSTEYQLQQLASMFPLPASATTVQDSTGRHLKERTAQRRPLTVGAHVRESRRGRPGADASLLMLAGSEHFGYRSGLVHGVHFAWSGNHRISAERTITSDNFLTAGELLLPGEVVLAPGESYTTPWALGSWGYGLDELSARFHDDLRARPHHPSRPRPVTLNTWEAVYFNHDLTTLEHLADKAAAVGVERFVLDDGWFLGRRDDTAGLGDWIVDPAVWAEGLHPIIDHVRGLGMEFGLWFEPEMVNPDSELARNHPEWILHTPGRWPVSARQQQALNLAHPDCFDYLLTRLDVLLSEYPISYIKWDHNRDLLEASDPRSGHAAVRDSTLALYRLLGELKSRHPELEIESCASGGARVDLGILEFTDRIWTSDCIDPLERLDNQANTSLLVPYELMGAHIGGPSSHSTRRQHSLGFMARTAIFGHFGIEWNIADISAEHTAELTQWVSFHKEYRDIFHTGRSVHADLPDPALDVRGVIAADGERAVFALTQRTASTTYPSGRITLPGLAPDSRYRVSLSHPLDDALGNGQSPLAWASHETILSGQLLASTGIQSPVLFPEQAVLIVLTRVDADPRRAF
ncbi:alpha-galactosidase [Arthrobacter psychrolactophilus]|uniref:alpha-galactosidase n=1 Tax=Arthrobacter psychrolactophilus TaxID=92442 RepID=A0A2V5J5J8_9MICC|nr:alpha-galactosidase [Arthrobacter psychrolactophilus]PYI37800.1 alpha-galactosidase [Arthrobacter psychrolactophilus]